jgi:hypothetical protein
MAIAAASRGQDILGLVPAGIASILSILGFLAATAIQKPKEVTGSR